MYVGIVTVAGFVWWFTLSDTGPRLTWRELVSFEACVEGEHHYSCKIFSTKGIQRPSTVSMWVAPAAPPSSGPPPIPFPSHGRAACPLPAPPSLLPVAPLSHPPVFPLTELNRLIEALRPHAAWSPPVSCFQRPRLPFRPPRLFSPVLKDFTSRLQLLFPPSALLNCTAGPFW